MAGVTALRDAARTAMLSCGGRGFVRFLAQGDALLVCDAIRRCENEAQESALIAAFLSAGFVCDVQDGLLYLTPGEALLKELCGAAPERIAVDWAHPLCEEMALCDRLLKEKPQPPDDGARRLTMDMVRLLWQPGDKVIAGLPALRAQIAVRLRMGKRAGLHEAGRLLAGWMEENR